MDFYNLLYRGYTGEYQLVSSLSPTGSTPRGRLFSSSPARQADVFPCQPQARKQAGHWYAVIVDKHGRQVEEGYLGTIGGDNEQYPRLRRGQPLQHQGLLDFARRMRGNQQPGKPSAHARAAMQQAPAPKTPLATFGVPTSKPPSGRPFGLCGTKGPRRRFPVPLTPAPSGHRLRIRGPLPTNRPLYPFPS